MSTFSSPPNSCTNYYVPLEFLLHALIGSVVTFCILELRRKIVPNPNSTAATRSFNPECCSSSSHQRSSSQGSFLDCYGDDHLRNESFQEKDVCAVKSGTTAMVLSELDAINDEAQTLKFEELVVSKISNLEECKLLLYRMRSVTALVSRLMVSPDEDSCYEIATRLLVPLFKVHGCSYAMRTDPDHVIFRVVAADNRQEIENSGINFDGVKMPLKGMMLGVVAETLEQQYCPRMKDSQYIQHQTLQCKLGINSILTTPILGANNTFTGAIVMYMREEDAFSEHDRMLIQDVASMLGAILYAKRMRRAADNSHKVSKKMLHSMIPSNVIEKIQVFWDENSDEFQKRRSSLQDSLSRSSSHEFSDKDLDFYETATTTPKETNNISTGLQRSESVAAKLNFLQQIQSEDMMTDEMTNMILDDASYDEDRPMSGALYAENVEDVVIIFVDIVGFSKTTMDMSPVEVMNMLEALFSHFDRLCEKHNVEKLETIGDAYICTTNLFDDFHGGDVKKAARSALNMAKDMIYACNDVRISVKNIHKRRCSLEMLKVRVGIHVGEVTCGVLGERLPKFTVLGHNVNVAARMEQTVEPNTIRASEEFCRLLSDTDYCGGEYEVISMKNMGSIGTFKIDPFKYGGKNFS